MALWMQTKAESCLASAFQRPIHYVALTKVLEETSSYETFEACISWARQLILIHLRIMLRKMPSWISGCLACPRRLMQVFGSIKKHWNTFLVVVTGRFGPRTGPVKTGLKPVKIGTGAKVARNHDAYGSKLVPPAQKPEPLEVFKKKLLKFWFDGTIKKVTKMGEIIKQWLEQQL